MQLYHPHNAKEIMDSLGHPPLQGKAPPEDSVDSLQAKARPDVRVDVASRVKAVPVVDNG